MVLGLALLGTAVVHWVGFGSGGVIANSTAACIHAWIGNVSAGGAFAALQSAGATGAGALVNSVGAVAAAAATRGGTSAYRYFRGRRAARQEALAAAAAGAA